MSIDDVNCIPNEATDTVNKQKDGTIALEILCESTYDVPEGQLRKNTY